MAHDVFISYSSKNKLAADMVCAVLERAGVRCWVAPRDILTGANWAESILKAIAASRVMVLVFSQSAQDSQHVRREVERAVHHGIAVAPIRIHDVMPTGDLEYYLSSSHWMDAITAPLERHLDRFCRSVTELLAIQSGTDGSSSQSVLANAEPRFRGRRMAWLAGIGVVAAACFVGWVVLAGSQSTTASHSGQASPPVPAPVLSIGATRSQRTYTNSVKIRMVEIKPGEFVMGSPVTEPGRLDDELQHHVKLTKPFMLGVFEVTRDQFSTFVTESGYQTGRRTRGVRLHRS